jgi:hypothetical protein
MLSRINTVFSEYAVHILLGIISFLICLTVFMVDQNRKIITENIALQQQTELVKKEMTFGFDKSIRHVDVTLRGYAIIPEERYLYISVKAIKDQTEESFNNLDSLLAAQGFQDEVTLKELDEYKRFLTELIGDYEKMVTHIKSGEYAQFLEIFKKDKGNLLGDVYYDKVKTKIFAFEDGLNAKAESRFRNAVQDNLYFQIALLVISLPSICLVIYKLRREGTLRNRLLARLHDNNRTYLFDVGNTEATTSDESIIETSIQNLQKANNFISEIAAGNFDVNWDGLTPENRSLNNKNLAGKLVEMRDIMISVKAEDEKRNWVNVGLASFSEIIRNQQHDVETLCSEGLRFLTKYIGCQQGALFIAEKANSDDNHLRLAATYAFEKKKFIEKRVEIGSGLVGQVFLEGETTYLKKLPPGYTHITSGLGDATPNHLVIVPMAYNNVVEAVMELASFGDFEKYQIKFLEKCGEFLAAAILSATTAQKMTHLLTESKLQTEALRAQEEEMRQNMEELTATQEEMQRKEREYLAQIDRLSLSNGFAKHGI